MTMVCNAKQVHARIFPARVNVLLIARREPFRYYTEHYRERQAICIKYCKAFVKRCGFVREIYSLPVNLRYT